MPAALTYNLMNDRVNWFYATEPQAQMDGRRLYWPRGRVLGGSSSINAMVYVRGHALDYDRWVEEGAAAGPTPRCCPISGAPRPSPAAPTPTVAATGRCSSPAAPRQPAVRRLDRGRRAGRLPGHAPT